MGQQVYTAMRAGNSCATDRGLAATAPLVLLVQLRSSSTRERLKSATCMDV